MMSEVDEQEEAKRWLDEWRRSTAIYVLTSQTRVMMRHKARWEGVSAGTLLRFLERKRTDTEEKQA